jgi:hypothetical protein
LCYYSPFPILLPLLGAATASSPNPNATAAADADATNAANATST